MRRSVFLTAALTSAVLALSACGGGAQTAEVSSTAPTDRTLKLAFLDDPGQPPDPDVFYAGQGLVLQQNLYEGLLQYAPGTDTPEVQPALATEWTASPDGTEYTFTLREGVTFHDGTPFDSSAVKASFDRRAAVGQGPSYMVSGVASVEATSPTQVVVRLTQPDPAFLSYLASAYGPRMISPTALAENAGDDHAQTWLATHDAGTGPYTLTEASVGERYELEAFDGYWGEAPYFTTVQIPVLNDSSALQVQFNEGDVHAIMYGLGASASTSYAEAEGVSTHALPVLQTEQLYLNPHKGFLTTPENRTALLQAVDVDTIREQVFGGRSTPATGTFPANLLPEGTAPQTVEHDTGPLEDLVATLPEDQKALTIGFDASNDDDQTVSSLLAAELGALGLTATVQGLTTSQIFGYVGGDPTEAPEVLITGAWPDSGEAFSWAHIIYDGAGGLNYLGCSDDALTAAIATASASSSVEDPAAWAPVGERAEETACWLNLAYRQDFMVGQDWLTGVEEAHVVTAPTSLQLARLGVQGAS